MRRTKNKKNKMIKHRPSTLERREYKRKIRASSEWATLRKYVAEIQEGKDPITQRPLVKSFNLHHLSQCWTSYGNLEYDRFVALNHKSHELIHCLYDYYKITGSFDFLDKCKDTVLLMEQITKEDELIPEEETPYEQYRKTKS